MEIVHGGAAPSAVGPDVVDMECHLWSSTMTDHTAKLVSFQDMLTHVGRDVSR